MTGAIRRVHLLVEGQTEEVVADAVIRPHLEGLGWVISLDVLTTLFDYYAFPVDCPGMGDQPSGDVYERVAHVERCLADAVGDRRFRPNLVVHELEAWVFAAADELGQFLGPELAERLRGDVRVAGNPELVNDGPSTAPSKRLLGYCPGYVKTVDGPLAIQDLGLARLRAQCPHLDAWLHTFEE